MKFNICIIQPQNYIHSFAFLELAELLMYSLKDLGHEAALQFNAIDRDARNIIIGFHLLDIKYIDIVPKNSILINAEQLRGGTPWNKNILSWINKFEIWDYSPQNIEFFTQMGIFNIKHLKLGYQNELARIITKDNKTIDVLFYGSVNERRAKILEGLKSHGLNVHASFGVYGKERDDLIASSKVVLNMHYYESQIFEVVRVFYLLTNAVPVVSEINSTTSVNSFYKEAVVGAPYENLIESCIKMVNNQNLLDSQAAKGLEVIKNNPQKIYTAELLV